MKTKKMKKAFYLVIAIMISLGIMVYQRLTGPTHPKRITFELAKKKIKIKLPRSESQKDCRVLLATKDSSVNATLFYKRYPIAKEFTKTPLQYIKNKGLIGYLPKQPPAGKLEYYIEVESIGQTIRIPEKENIRIRFKGDVPNFILLPHIFFMVLAMIFSTYTGILALFKENTFKKFSFFSLIFLFTGGLLLGPLVQFYAFGDLWTGIPLGKDLTDNKTLIAFIGWLAAYLLNQKKDRPWLVVIASLILLAVYGIPHSAMGSEYNYETGKVVTGMVFPFIY